MGNLAQNQVSCKHAATGKAGLQDCTNHEHAAVEARHRDVLLQPLGRHSPQSVMKNPDEQLGISLYALWLVPVSGIVEQQVYSVVSLKDFNVKDILRTGVTVLHLYEAVRYIYERAVKIQPSVVHET